MANGLPLEFFARVIWQESRLRPDAIGPVTRSGHQAQGIAQFMPMTAAERLLQNPFDPTLPPINLRLAAGAIMLGGSTLDQGTADRHDIPT